MKPDMGLIADAALTALHENAKRVERVAMQLPEGHYRDELVWIVEAMMNAGDQGRAGIRQIALGKQ